ncbi:MAG: hypothetical protein Q7K57_10955 [Burkholderiaceae bacterium]|nr:hypothetical protein [Burkholderiaceae bacterium]
MKRNPAKAAGVKSQRPPQNLHPYRMLNRYLSQKRGEDAPAQDGFAPPSMTTAICIAMKSLGMASVNPGNADYRTDVLSNRELARLYGVKDGAIRNRAKAEGWERDLKEQVQERVVSELANLESSQELRTELRTLRTPYAQGDEVRNGEVRTDQEIIESVAAMVVAVVCEHRTQIASGCNMGWPRR